MSGDPASNGQRARLEEAIRSIRRLQGRIAELERGAREPIAIIGCGCRFPGNVAGPDDYWKLLEGGVDAISEVPPERWDAAAWYDPDPEQPGKMYTTAGGFVDGIELFDAEVFGFSPREAAKIDPQHRLVLEVAWEALEHAGLPPKGLAESATGVYLGITAFDYGLHLSHLDSELIDAYTMTGTKLNFASGRVAYALGLQGPALSVDTACSSSLVALHLACQALRRDECELALAGGVNAMLTPDQTVAECKARMLAPDGRCKTFDARADGFSRGEGCGMLVLERLSRAEREGHPVLAVIRGTAINQDGPTSGPTVPNRLAQEAVIRAALQDAGLAPDDIDYVEAHGTGTPLGDPIEVRALANVFRGRAAPAPLGIGSVKTNFGHLEAAAGVAGVLKVVLGLQREALPPHLHFRTPNPAIDWNAIPIEVVTARTPWPAAARPRRAGVSSFGASGTNAHIVVEEAPAAAAVPEPGRRPYHVYCLSAVTETSLRSLAARHAAALPHVREIEDACRTAGVGRSHFRHRLAALGASRDELCRGLDAFSAGQPSANVLAAAHARVPRVAFLLPGRAGAAARAGRDLYGHQAEFTQRIDACAELLRPQLGRALPDLLFGDAVDELRRPQYAEPASCALQYALAGMWQSFGVMPQALFGCGSGEYAAACIAGALSLVQALGLAMARGRVLESLGDGGAMAAIAAAEETVAAALGNDRNVSIAAVNAPDSVVISGARGDIDRAVAAFAGAGVEGCRLDGSQALQSPLLEPLLDEFSAAAGDIAAAAPRLKLVSSIDVAPVSRDGRLDAGYWRRQLRETVRFDAAMQALAADGCDAFLELGPGASMSRLARRCLPTRRALWAHSLDAGRGDWQALCEALAALYVGGASIDWSGVYRGAARATLRLPTYSFDRQRHWLDAQPFLPAAGAPSGRDTGHPLLGARLSSPLAAVQYATQFRTDHPRWLADHRVFERVVVPATAYLEMLLAAARDASGAAADLRDVFIHAPIVAGPEAATCVQTVVEAAGDEYRLRIASANKEGGWTQHVSARAQRGHGALPVSGQEDLALLGGRIAERVPIDAHYRAMADSGVEFGPAFRTVTELWRGDGESLGRVRAAGGNTPAGDGGCWMHPALLDGCLQVAREALPEAVRADRDAALVPMQLAGLSIHGTPAGSLLSHARLAKKALPAGTYELDLAILDESGKRLATLSGLRLARVDRGMLAASDGTGTDRYRLEWRPKPRVPQADGPARDTNWLVFAYGDPLAERCVDELRRGYDRVHVVRQGSQLELNDDANSVLRVAEPGDFRKVVAATVGAGGGSWIVVHSGGMAAAHAEPDAAAIRAAHELHLQGLLHTAQALEASPVAARFFVVTHAAQDETAAQGLAGASLWGLGRVLQNELPRLGTVLLDLHDLESGPRQLIAEAAAGDGENQVLYRDGERYVARLGAADGSTGDARHGGPTRLVLETAGIPDSLALRPLERRAPGPGQVEIEVAAAGLNFRDVLVVLGVYQGPAGPLGGECAGTISAVGAGVDAFSVGDPVLAFATGAMASHVITDARLVWQQPARVDDAAAATVPIAFLTAAYCLEHLGRMSRGDRVLIHGAAGGVGMAAVQLARRAGAEIFGSAGTPEKRRLLATLGVHHSLDSRSLDFADEIMRLTGGEGVDLVLNSLAGEFIPASLRATKQGGRFVEIGRTDIWSASRVAALRPDLEYHTVLLGDVCESDPLLIHEIGAGLVSDIAAGKLLPLPRRTWPMRRAAAAFRLMARAGHTGKLVLRNDAAPTAPGAALVQGDGAYLVTGGYGGLGLELARWLAGEGAGVITLLGRHGADARARAVIDELSAAGATILALTGNVADEADMRRVLADIAKTGRPLRGVFHAAGTLDDGIVAEQTWARVRSVLEAKVSGAMVLHELTADLPLDLFVLFSSASALFGAAGQAGYAAGNAFLDALARWRRQSGLAALGINWGPWSDAGMFVDSGATGRRAVLERGFRLLPAARNLAAMRRLLQQQAVEAGVFSLDWTAFRAAQPDGAPLTSELAAATPDAAPQRGAFAAEVRSAPAGRRRQLVRNRLREEVAAVLGNTASSIQTGQGFREQGMDSLMSVELRNRLERLLDCSLVSTLAFDHPNVESLADHLLTEVLAVNDRGATAAAAQRPRDELAAEVDELTDDEAEQLLMQELQRMGRSDGHG